MSTEIQQLINLFNAQSETIVAYKNIMSLTRKVESLEIKLDKITQMLSLSLSPHFPGGKMDNEKGSEKNLI